MPILFSLSQGYYYGKANDNPDPNHQAIIVHGKPLDLHNNLEQYEANGAKVNAPKADGKKAKGFEILSRLDRGRG